MRQSYGQKTAGYVEAASLGLAINLSATAGTALEIYFRAMLHTPSALYPVKRNGCRNINMECNFNERRCDARARPAAPRSGEFQSGELLICKSLLHLSETGSPAAILKSVEKSFSHKQAGLS